MSAFVVHDDDKAYDTLADAAARLAVLVADVAGGVPSKPERLGHREYFIMYKHQDTPPLAQGCRA